MENKYYSPKIEELHIGFECEIDQSEINKNFKWCEYVIGTDYETITIARAVSEVNKNGIRIKYLDRQDIESFGFKLFENMPSRFHYNKYELDVDYLNVIRIEYDCNYIFKGRIKNKSELKKLLIQLEIINE
jgi:hypothetical protein